MNMLTRFLLTFHRILGTLLCLLFFVWFASGLVMINHSRFPRIDQADRIAKFGQLDPSALPSPDSLRKMLPQQIEGLTLDNYLDLTAFHAKSGAETTDIAADSTTSLPVMNWERINNIVALWNTSPILKVDTLHKLDQWIPFGRNKAHLPVYKFYFDDQERHQMYVSSQTCEPIQYTDKESRFWAWLGPIPHWIYFTSLRQNTELWCDVVIWLSGIGCLMVIAGLYLGIRDFRLARKRQAVTPFKKFWYKWHHVLGLFFGIFVLTFCFSGMMSLADVEDIGIRPKLEISPREELRKMAPSPIDHPLDYRKVVSEYASQIKQLEWSSFGNIPLYVVHTADKDITIDARQTDNVMPLALTEEDVKSVVSSIHGSEEMTVSLMEEYDHYYLSRSGRLALPVWKVKIDDVDKSCWYVNPANGQSRYYNTPSRIGRWTYSALHSFSIKFLVDRPWLWNILMWGLMILGLCISFSAIPLAVRYIVRLFRRYILHSKG